MRLYPQCWLQQKPDQTESREWMMHRWIAGPLLAILMLFIVPETWGAVRYVSKSGADNPGCGQFAPCGTIQHAVDVASPGDTISIGQGKFLENGGIIITKNLTVNGAGTFYTSVGSAWSGFSIFHIRPEATAAITEMYVMNGDAEIGGGILNDGHLTLERVAVGKNSAEQGGGIFNRGVLLMSKSYLVLNSASDSGGGLNNQGYAVLTEVAIERNHGNGITTTLGVLWDVELSLIVKHSTISHNIGGGIAINGGGMSLANTTVSRNGDVGIWANKGSYTRLTHVTVAENGKTKQHPYSSQVGLEAEPGSDVDLVNTIVANNAVAQCQLNGGFVDARGGLISDNTCHFFPSSGDLNLVSVDPQLGPLKYNGGSTRTHALKKGSPAIDAGYPSDCESVDQRGVLRPIDGNLDGTANCDIGAFEYKPKMLEQPH